MQTVENIVDQVKKYNSGELVKEIKELADGGLQDACTTATGTLDGVAKELSAECEKEDANILKIIILIGGAAATLAGMGVGLWFSFHK